MKKLITIIAILFTLTAVGQNAKIDSKGNYTAITKINGDTATLKANGATYSDKSGKVYPVYVSSKNKVFIKKISKKGSEYKMYLTTEKK